LLFYAARLSDPAGGRLRQRAIRFLTAIHGRELRRSREGKLQADQRVRNSSAPRIFQEGEPKSFIVDEAGPQVWHQLGNSCAAPSDDDHVSRPLNPNGAT
jgi:hypothetical protein